MKPALFCLVLFGCSDGPVDDCGNVGFDPCVTFHLSAEPELVDAFVTSIAMWVTANLDGQLENKLVPSQMQAPTHFPIAVGLDISTGVSGKLTVRIEALNGPGPVAYNVVSVTPAVDQHQSIDVMMLKPATSGCFNNTLDSSESDVDCGGNCPPCAAGRRCIGPSDCQSADCPGAGQLCQ